MSSIGVLAEMASHLERGSDIQDVIRWSCPVPFFGQLTTAGVATIGLNPSDQEFCDDSGTPLTGHAARLPSLELLGIETWSAATHTHLQRVATACNDYFDRQPYTRWFAVLERVLNRMGASYYSRERSAVHIDLFPFATDRKWSQISTRQRHQLLELGRPWFEEVLASSQVQWVILNGTSVVAAAQEVLQVELAKERAPDLDLPRARGADVPGWWFSGQTSAIAGRRVNLVGWNHNLQSSFGVTAAVHAAVAQRLANATAGEKQHAC